jgi:hypothetical protein
MRKEFVEICHRHRKRVQQIRGGVGKIKDKLGDGHREVRVSNGCCHHVVIVSGRNISAKRREQVLREAKRCEPQLYVYVLSDGMTLNNASTDLSRLRIYRRAFDRLLKRLKR